MKPAVRFQTLPTELHLLIYQFLFADEDEQRFPHPLLQVSETIYVECVPILLPELEMYIDGNEEQDYGGWTITFRSIGKSLWPRPKYRPHWYSWPTIRDDPEMAILLPYLDSLHFGYNSCLHVSDIQTIVDFNFHESSVIPSQVSCSNCWIRDGYPLTATEKAHRANFRTLIGDSPVCTPTIIGKLMYIIGGRTLEFDHPRWSWEGETVKEVERQLWSDGDVPEKICYRLADGNVVYLIPPAEGQDVVAWLEEED